MLLRDVVVKSWIGK